MRWEKERRDSNKEDCIMVLLMALLMALVYLSHDKGEV